MRFDQSRVSVGAVAPVGSSEGCTGSAGVVIVDDYSEAAPAAVVALVNELARGRRITIFPSASPALAAAALEALR